MTTTPPEYPENQGNVPPNQPNYGPPNQPGYGQNYGQQPYYGAPAPKAPRPKWLIPVIAGAAALILILVLIFAFTRGGDDKTVTTPVTAAPPVTTTAPQVPVVTTPPVAVTTPAGTDDTPSRAGANEDGYLQGLLLTDSTGVNHADYWQSRVTNQKADVLKLGYAICSAYDADATPTQIVQAMTDKGIPSTEANWARASAVVMLCPEYKQ